jgi:hypothetical protein
MYPGDRGIPNPGLTPEFWLSSKNITRVRFKIAVSKSGNFVMEKIAES